MKKRGLEDLRVWMDSVEAERLEFKEAKSNFDFEKLVRYCIALANEGGGVLVLGVTDKRPRKVVTPRRTGLPSCAADMSWRRCVARGVATR